MAHVCAVTLCSNGSVGAGITGLTARTMYGCIAHAYVNGAAITGCSHMFIPLHGIATNVLVLNCGSGPPMSREYNIIHDMYGSTRGFHSWYGQTGMDTQVMCLPCTLKGYCAKLLCRAGHSVAVVSKTWNLELAYPEPEHCDLIGLQITHL